jgi:hypothetical protein
MTTAGELYERCTESPAPAQPRNQAKCHDLISRLQREDVRAAAVEARKRAE